MNAVQLRPRAIVACLLSSTVLATSFLAQAPAEPVAGAPPQAALSRSGHDVMESKFCAECHPAIYAEHEQSTHGRAFTDDEVRLATGRFSVKDCIICHTPRPIFETGVGQNPRRRHHGLEEGNTCMTCHWQPDYDYSTFTGGAECSSAFHPDVGSVEACASCHRNHGTPYQWEKAPIGKAAGNSCIDCHMAEVERPVAVGGETRMVRTHGFPGARSEAQVRKAYSYKLEVEDSEAVVTIKNRGAGHNFPTELKQRALVSVVVVKDREGQEVGRSRMVFRDPYKRPYGLLLPVNTQIPPGETREHRVPLRVADGTIETRLYYKLYYPIEDHHPDLSKELETRVRPFNGITPSDKEVISAPEVIAVTPEGITAEASSVANLVDYARPPIGTVEIDVPQGDSPADIRGLIELFQFPVPAGNRAAQARLVEIGLPAVPALMEALGSWDNKTYNQAMKVLERIGTDARPAIVAGLESDQLYVRLHSRQLIERTLWRGEEIEDSLVRALDVSNALDRASAARALGLTGVRGYEQQLMRLLADPDPDVVREAALALSEVGAVEAADAIEVALGQAHYPETRRDLAMCLARLGSTAGMAALLEGLDEHDDLVRESFFEAFYSVTGEHGGYDAFAPRKARLAAIADLTAWWARYGSADVLKQLDPERDRFAEAHALSLVMKLGGTDLGPTGSEEDADICAELEAMGKYAVPALVQGLKYPSGFASKRAQICQTLGRIGDWRATPALVATLRDPVVSVAAWAAWALEGQADRATIPALKRYEQRLRQLIGTDTVPDGAGPGDRLLAQVARTRLASGDRAASRTLVTLLLSDDVATRQIAIGGLQQHYGEDRGYDPAAGEDERREAALRWAQ